MRKSTESHRRRLAELFDPSSNGSDLERKGTRGGLITLGSHAVKVVITMGSTAVLARLLYPEDFGLVEKVLGVVGLLTTLRDFGLSTALVQAPRLDHRRASSLFWAAQSVSLLVALVVALSAPALVWFFDDPAVGGVALGLAAVSVFEGLAMPHRALLRRGLRFSTLSAIELGSLLGAAASAVLSAYAGAGHWALVVFYAGNALLGLGAVWLSCGWFPSLPSRGSGVRESLRFGGFLSAAQLIGYASRNLDKVLIGQHWGSAAAGNYGRAHRLVLFPLNAINAPLANAAIPTLSRLFDRPERYRAMFLRGFRLSAALQMPIVACLAVSGEALVLTILGPRWESAVPVFNALIPAAFVATTAPATTWVFVSSGLVKEQLNVTVVSNVVVVIALSMALPFGPVGVAWALSLVTAALRVPTIAYCFRKSHPTMSDVPRAIWRPTLAAAFGSAAVLVLSHPVVPSSTPVVRLVVNVSAFLVTYVFGWLLVPGGWRAAREMYESVTQNSRK